LLKRDGYLKHAEECRELARVVIPTFRPRLIKMAEAWEQLAIERLHLIQSPPQNANDE